MKYHAGQNGHAGRVAGGSPRCASESWRSAPAPRAPCPRWSRPRLAAPCCAAWETMLTKEYSRFASPARLRAGRARLLAVALPVCWARALLLLLVCGSRLRLARLCRESRCPSPRSAPVAAARRARLRRWRASQASRPFATLRASRYALRHSGSALSARCFALPRPPRFARSFRALRAQFAPVSRSRTARKRFTTRAQRVEFHALFAPRLRRGKKASPSSRPPLRLFARLTSLRENPRIRQLRPAVPVRIIVDPQANDYNKKQYHKLHFDTNFAR